MGPEDEAEFMAYVSVGVPQGLTRVIMLHVCTDVSTKVSPDGQVGPPEFPTTGRGLGFWGSGGDEMGRGEGGVWVLDKAWGWGVGVGVSGARRVRGVKGWGWTGCRAVERTGGSGPCTVQPTPHRHTGKALRVYGCVGPAANGTPGRKATPGSARRYVSAAAPAYGLRPLAYPLTWPKL